MNMNELGKIVKLQPNSESKYSDLEYEFALQLEYMFDLFKRKNSCYGTDNISALGIKGIFVRLWDKVNRLKTLVWFGANNAIPDESVQDTFIDIAVYCIIALLILKQVWPGCKSE